MSGGETYVAVALEVGRHRVGARHECLVRRGARTRLVVVRRGHRRGRQGALRLGVEARKDHLGARVVGLVRRELGLADAHPRRGHRCAEVSAAAFDQCVVRTRVRRDEPARLFAQPRLPAALDHERHELPGNRVELGVRLEQREQRREAQHVHVRVEQRGADARVRMLPQEAHAQLEVRRILVRHVVRVHDEQRVVHRQRVRHAVLACTHALLDADRGARVGREQVRGPVALALLAGALAGAALVEQARHSRRLGPRGEVRAEQRGERHMRRNQVHRHHERVALEFARRGEPVEQLRGAPAHARHALVGVQQAAHRLTDLGAVRDQLHGQHGRRRRRAERVGAGHRRARGARDHGDVRLGPDVRRIDVGRHEAQRAQRRRERRVLRDGRDEQAAAEACGDDPLQRKRDHRPVEHGDERLGQHLGRRLAQWV